MIVLGIDPGLTGGLACVVGLPGEKARLLDAGDIPTTGEKAKRRVDVLAVMQWIRQHAPDHAVIERAQAMPSLPDKNGIRRGMGASSSFNYGRAVGALETCAEGLLIPLTVIESTAWKKAHALIKTGKEDSRQRAIKLFPGNHSFFARKMDHGRAEAALIAWYGLMLLRGTIPANSGNIVPNALDLRADSR